MAEPGSRREEGSPGGPGAAGQGPELRGTPGEPALEQWELAAGSFLAAAALAVTEPDEAECGPGPCLLASFGPSCCQGNWCLPLHCSARGPPAV